MRGNECALPPRCAGRGCPSGGDSRARAGEGACPRVSGETDVSGRISKIGDASVRTALYQAAHIMLTGPIKGCSQLKGWAMRIARRAGMKKAKVALARKLAVILHRMLVTGTPFNVSSAVA